MHGRLYLVATPIGNLEDITYRAVRILSESACIACEDTRQTRKLLEHYGIHRPVVSYHQHNEAARTPQLIARLLSGDDVALVSDAGTPLVSDPGAILVSTAIANQIRVEPIPGPSAILAALSASGFPADEFHFSGFLPARSSARRNAIAALKEFSSPIVLYEAPHRILATLADLAEILGERPMAAARELTKLHEEILRGTAASIRDELASRGAVKGEFTLVIGAAAPAPPPEMTTDQLRTRFQKLTSEGMSRMDAIKTIARSLGVPKSEVYRRLER